MSRKVISVLSVLATLFTLSCNRSFDPRAPFQQKLVVFSVLSTDRTSQFVRVETDYMPSDFNPVSSTTDLSVTNANVTLTDGSTVYKMRDTVLSRLDTARYKSPLHAFVLDPFSVQSGKSYQISVIDPQGKKISASATIPGRSIPSLALSSSLIVDNPKKYDSQSEIILNGTVSTATRGFFGRLFVDYDVLIGNEWIEGRTEIPLAFVDPNSPDLRYVTYTQLTVRSADRTVFVFKNAVYMAILQSLASKTFAGNKVIFNRVVFQFLQTDKNLFNYYSTTHAFRDAQSIRLDEPLFSNVSGGYGIVGAYAVDSLVHLLPESFIYNNK